MLDPRQAANGKQLSQMRIKLYKNITIILIIVFMCGIIPKMKAKTVQILSIPAIIVGLAIFSISLRSDQTSRAKSLNTFVLDHITASSEQKGNQDFALYANALASTLSNYSPEEISRIFPGMKLPGAE